MKHPRSPLLILVQSTALSGTSVQSTNPLTMSYFQAHPLQQVSMSFLPEDFVETDPATTNGTWILMIGNYGAVIFMQSEPQSIKHYCSEIKANDRQGKRKMQEYKVQGHRGIWNHCELIIVPLML